MPLYEYKCSKCEKTFEVMQKFSDAPLSVHEECGGQVERLLSAPAFQLKGTGWYITDYARGGKSQGESGKSGEGKSADGEGSKPESAKSESKSETKTGSTTSDSSGAKSG